MMTTENGPDESGSWEKGLKPSELIWFIEEKM